MLVVGCNRLFIGWFIYDYFSHTYDKSEVDKEIEEAVKLIQQVTRNIELLENQKKYYQNELGKLEDSFSLSDVSVSKLS